MRRIHGGLWPALIILLVVAALTSAIAPGADAKCNDRLPLHPGSCGQSVKDLQWLLGGHRPNVFREVKPTFKWAPNGAYGARTKSAVTAYKYRIGYPQKGQCGSPINMVSADSTGPQFFSILEGKTKRFACWVSLAASRLKAIIAAEPSKIALDVRSIMVGWLGISETYYSRAPHYFNVGPCISSSCTWRGKSQVALQSSTGQFNVAWCVSTVQEAFKEAGYGTFAERTAGVYFAVDYYAARNLVFAKAKMGSLVAFITYDRYGHRAAGTGHMGFVVKVEANSFTYVAGNDSNGVREHTISFGSRPYVFIRLPRVA